MRKGVWWVQEALGMVAGSTGSVMGGRGVQYGRKVARAMLDEADKASGETAIKNVDEEAADRLADFAEMELSRATTRFALDLRRLSPIVPKGIKRELSDEEKDTRRALERCSLFCTTGRNVAMRELVRRDGAVFDAWVTAHAGTMPRKADAFAYEKSYSYQTVRKAAPGLASGMAATIAREVDGKWVSERYEVLQLQTRSAPHYRVGQAFPIRAADARWVWSPNEGRAVVTVQLFSTESGETVQRFSLPIEARDEHQRNVLRNLASGEWKAGEVKIERDRLRPAKWYLRVGYKRMVPRRVVGPAAAINRGMRSFLVAMIEGRPREMGQGVIEERGMAQGAQGAGIGAQQRGMGSQGRWDGGHGMGQADAPVPVIGRPQDVAAAADGTQAQPAGGMVAGRSSRSDGQQVRVPVATADGGRIDAVHGETWIYDADDIGAYLAQMKRRRQKYQRGVKASARVGRGRPRALKSIEHLSSVGDRWRKTRCQVIARRLAKWLAERGVSRVYLDDFTGIRYSPPETLAVKGESRQRWIWERVQEWPYHQLGARLEACLAEYGISVQKQETVGNSMHCPQCGYEAPENRDVRNWRLICRNPERSSRGRVGCGYSRHLDVAFCANALLRSKGSETLRVAVKGSAQLGEGAWSVGPTARKVARKGAKSKEGGDGYDNGNG